MVKWNKVQFIPQIQKIELYSTSPFGEVEKSSILNFEKI